MGDPVLPTVFIVDDDVVIRRFCVAVLDHEGLPSQEYTCAREFLEHYDPVRPGCLLLDMRMPGMTGLELQEELNRRGAVIPVIFATGVAEVPIAVEAMLQGAFDYLQKPISPSDLLERVRRALAFDASTRASLLEHRDAQERFAQLSEREREVLTMVMGGLSNKQVAGRMRLSSRTVEIHRASLMKKTGARNAAHLVRMAMELQSRASGAK